MTLLRFYTFCKLNKKNHFYINFYKYSVDTYLRIYLIKWYPLLPLSGQAMGQGVGWRQTTTMPALLQLLFFVLLFFKDSSLTVHPILCDPEVSMDFCSTGHKANGKVFFIKFFHVYFNLTSKLWFPYNRTWRYPFSFKIVGKVI